MNRRKRVARRGMTLIEIMVVLVILGMMAGIVGVAVFRSKRQADIDVARLDIRGYSQAVELSRIRRPTLPESLEELVPNQLERVRRDPWGTAYVYVRSGDTFEIFSYGPDHVASDDDIREEEPKK
jgi:general secretion pathway protein G